MSDERIRLFVALELPAGVRESLVEWRTDAVGGIAGLRLVSADSLHVTLCFLGWQAPDDAPRIAAAVRAAVSELPAPELTVDEAIWLPRRRPRVLAVALDDAADRLLAGQEALSETLSAGGWYRPEKRPFLGHVTVARAGRAGLSRPPSLPEPPAMTFPGERVTLFRSRLERGGARYEALATVCLSRPR